jgi:hypothetical protein
VAGMLKFNTETGWLEDLGDNYTAGEDSFSGDNEDDEF